MEKRFLSLDFLRGMSIFGMIFSAIVPYGVLPAWMYHIQNPPPTHALDVSVQGIGWVDLVFPVFIFCMGAAIPLSGQKKLGSCGEAGSVGGSDAAHSAGKWTGARTYLGGCFSRFLMLWLFSYLYVLTNFSTAQGIWPQVFTVLGFGAISLVYVVLRKKVAVVTGGDAIRSAYGCGRWRIRLLGAVLVAGIIVVGHFWFDEVVSVHRRGIIIFLLAFLYLFGSVIWYFTRNNIRARWVVFGVLLLFTYITKELGWPASTYANPNVRWWFNMEYFYFLLILVPATFVGEMLGGKCEGAAVSDSAVGTEASGGGLLRSIFFWCLPVFVAWQCYALYMNWFVANMAVSAVVSAVVSVVAGSSPVAGGCGARCRELMVLAGAFLLSGQIFVFVEGGISKVPCTISYCLVTFAIAVYLLMFADFVCGKLCGVGGMLHWAGAFFVKVFSGAGQNPLMSYIAFDNRVLSLLKITALVSVYRAASLPEYPITGVVRAAVAVIFTMWLVYRLGKRGFRWRA